MTFGPTFDATVGPMTVTEASGKLRISSTRVPFGKYHSPRRSE